VAGGGAPASSLDLELEGMILSSDCTKMMWATREIDLEQKVRRTGGDGGERLSEADGGTVAPVSVCGRCKARGRKQEKSMSCSSTFEAPGPLLGDVEVAVEWINDGDELGFPSVAALEHRLGFE
jgi:hypothetical protein